MPELTIRTLSAHGTVSTINSASSIAGFVILVKAVPKEICFLTASDITLLECPNIKEP